MQTDSGTTPTDNTNPNSTADDAGLTLAPEAYAIVPNAHYTRPDWLDLTPATRLVYIALLAFRNAETGVAWPGQATIARMVGVTRRAVQVAIRHLEVLGYLETKRRYVSGRTRCTYRFPLIDQCAARFASPEATNAKHGSHRSTKPTRNHMRVDRSVKAHPGAGQGAPSCANGAHVRAHEHTTEQTNEHAAACAGLAGATPAAATPNPTAGAGGATRLTPQQYTGRARRYAEAAEARLDEEEFAILDRAGGIEAVAEQDPLGIEKRSTQPPFIIGRDLADWLRKRQPPEEAA